MAYQNTQPGAVPQMQAATGGNRNVANKPFNSNGEREWSKGLCDCYDDCGTWWLAACCPCIVYSQNKSRLEHLERQGYPHPEGGNSFGGDCFIHGVLTALGGCGCSLGWIVQMSNRSRVRYRYKVAGGGCGDCCTSLLCAPCELTQESIELGLEEKSILPKQ